MDAAREQQIRQWVEVAKAGDDLLPGEWELIRQDIPDLLAALDAARAERDKLVDDAHWLSVQKEALTLDLQGARAENATLRERVAVLTAALLETKRWLPWRADDCYWPENRAAVARALGAIAEIERTARATGAAGEGGDRG